jgi:hypothetical protein
MECGKQHRLHNGGLPRGIRCDTRITEVSQKQVRSLLTIYGVSAIVTWAAAPMKMALKTLDTGLVKTSGGYASPACPINKVLRGSDVLLNSRPHIACLAQLICKTLKLRPSRAAAKFLNAYWGFETLFEHDVLLRR